MTEYITREAALMAVCSAELPDKTEDGTPILNGKRKVSDCVRRIKAIPAADVVEVVRCKDCKSQDEKHCTGGELMGVYIGGMEMPMGGRILIVFPSGRVLEVSADATQDIFRETKAVPVPPHGRLIDADALSEYIVECSKRVPKDSFEFDLCGEVITQLALAPTIIEAEGE